ncbi:MAG: hypothetical protein EOM36_09655 [Bacteroidia bacterium]|nr:hypothetical protein [Bacteroidia bacterium]
MRRFLILLVFIPLISGCGIYSFSGTSIAPDVESITVMTIQNRAMRVNPALSNLLTEELKEKYRRLTKLRLDPDNGDLIVEGDITSYETTALAVTSQEVASQNRLTVTVKIKFTNVKHPDESFEKSFAGFEDYASTMSLDAVESSLVDSIVEKIVDLIFNDTVANW